MYPRLAVAACSTNRAIGYQGKIPWFLPKDLAFFKYVTQNKIMWMGSKTLLSLPKLLPSRHHIVITRQPDVLLNSNWVKNQKDLTRLSIVKHFDEASAVTHTLIQKGWSDLVILAGGGELYQQLVPRCQAVFLTEVNINIQPADAFFPQLDVQTWPVLKQSPIVIGPPDFQIQWRGQVIDKNIETLFDDSLTAIL